MPKVRRSQGADEEAAIGTRLREARVHRGLTQVQLAEILQVDQSLISEYERGVVRIHGALLAAFAKALRVSADELLGLKPQRRNGSAPDPRFARRLQYIGRLSKRDKQALLRNIDHFLKGAGASEEPRR